ncbi:MAG: LysM peptidoglycan-binding domain-containing protein, partial [Chloroflexi bacterium]|nr:LysM peptidoglycan-binding domain-containing protein [Chloroflexota bacterium]
MSTLFPSALLHLFGRLSCLAALVAFLAWPGPAFASEDGLLSTAMAGSANRAWPVAEVLVDPVAGSLELQTSTRTHIVGRGDTLDELARRYDTTVRAIVDANRIANPDRISEGQRLVIPIASARTGASRGGERLSIGFGPDGQISATLETEQRTSELANELAIG